MSRTLALALALMCSHRSAAQIVSASLDILDGLDAGAPTPEGTLVIDGFVDIGSTDMWTNSGTRWVAYNGVTIIYHDGDPTLPGIQPDVINTGAQNDRFVTLLSQPRERNADARFDNSGAAISSYYDTGPGGILDPNGVNVAYFATPPVTHGSPSVDGYTLRVALDISAPLNDLGASNDDVIISAARIEGLLLLAAVEGDQDGQPAPGWVNTTYSHSISVGSDAYVYLVPEPGAVVSLVLLAVMAHRRRRSKAQASD